MAADAYYFALAEAGALASQKDLPAAIDLAEEKTEGHVCGCHGIKTTTASPPKNDAGPLT
jgi:hypothetical protein